MTTLNRWLPATALMAAALLLAGCSGPRSSTTPESLRAEVTRTELAFAETMARRDFPGFASFIDEEAVFLNGGYPLRGKAAITAHWRKYYEGPQAPFSWKPDQVEVLPSGRLAQSIGPVFGPDGALIARFYSTWRRQSPGVWRIVFDNGYSVTGTPNAPSP